MADLKFIGIKFSTIKGEIETFLKNEYNKASILFSNASPYGQILSVIENLHQLSFMYLKNAINGFDVSLPNSLNERIIKNAAIFAGHIPSRGISSSGTLRLTLKTNVDLDKDIPGGRITISNRINIRNKKNSLDYSFNLGSEIVSHRITPNYSFFVPIVQGKWKKQTFTGDGEPLQTYQVTEIGQKDVENFNLEVLVNGDMYDIKKHIWDMIPDEKACVVRTGFNGGIDLIFGNGGFGYIPPIGSKIDLSYLLTDGSNGNIFRRTQNDWIFVDDVIDGNGNSIDAENIFNIDIYTDINFGADKESLKYTKSILPIVSNNFVLALPQQYAYEIKKLGVFSHVSAFEKSDTIFISVTPNINLFKNQSSNYFTINKGAFILDNYEKSKIDKYLRTSGCIQLTKKYKVISPILSHYAVNVFVMPYSDVSDESVSAQILDKISEYFLNLTRMGRIPKLDIVRELSLITDIHSVDIQFICKKNEDYHKENTQNIKSTGYASLDYMPTTTLGLDYSLGDIVFEPEELPVIRGGWMDRNDIYYSDDIDSSGLKAVNIIFRGKVDSKNRI